MTDPSTSFGQAAAEYARARPGYPAASLDWLLPSGARPIADIGAGTGKLTAALVGRGADVIAVEPDDAMRAAIATSAPGVATLAGTAEALPLPDASQDALVFGQAWHWVDPPRASLEAARVLRPGGTLGLTRNIRDERVPWVAELTLAMHGSPAEQLIASGGPTLAPPFAAPEIHLEDWTYPLTVDGLVELASSRSYVITAAPERRRQILDDVRALGLRTAGDDGLVAMPYVTHSFRAERP